jgi:RecB family endonuclease NucS
VAAVKAHITMGSYGNVDSGASDAEADVEDAIGAGFGLERDLQLELRRNIEQLEEGLVVIDGGKEQVVASGRIDITARDARGTVVVIELKANLADRDAVGQILSYVGDLVEDGTQVRAILVAREFTPRAESAARSVHNLRLVRYGIQFVFR